MDFRVLATSGNARRARLVVAHGVVETPVFMPVGTYGTVKAMAPAELLDLGAQIVLGNTFHLWLRPGSDVIAAHGGMLATSRRAISRPSRRRRGGSSSTSRSARSRPRVVSIHAAANGPITGTLTASTVPSPRRRDEAV
jgi:hypothetical protein